MTVVVKIGGARAVEPGGALADVAHLTANGEDVVVVHGGSTAVDDTLDAMGRQPEYVETPGGVVGRFTDAETMEVVTMAMAGDVSTNLTATLIEQGVPAVGLSGVDGDLLSGPRKSAVKVVEGGKKKIRRGDHSGRIVDVNVDLLDTLVSAGYTPVVSLPMLAVEGELEGTTERTPVNADADRAAAAVAAALAADLVILTDVPGVLSEPDDPDSLIEHVSTSAELAAVKAAAEGFMTRKVMAAEEALHGGAPSVVVADATVNDPILGALSGRGTHFEPAAVGVADRQPAGEDGRDEPAGEDGRDEPAGEDDETSAEGDVPSLLDDEEVAQP